jgi:hypothetical protein
VGQPIPDQFEAFSFNPIEVLPTLLFMSDQTCGLKHAKVPSCGLPSVFKDGGDFTCRHRTTIEINRKQHSAPRSVR